MYKQIIIARKDLKMSAGKLAAQVSHASIIFLISMINTNIRQNYLYEDDTIIGCFYNSVLNFDADLYEQWLNGAFTKIVLQAKNKNDLLKAVALAENLGLKEHTDYFLIRDNCNTELTPEEEGRTLTCIGFKPMPEEVINQISKKYHLYIG